MSVFSVMVRIDYGPDYTERYSAIVAAIKRQAVGSVWEEPTSTYIFQSSQTADDLCSAIYYGSPLIDSRDMLVVVNLSTKGSGSYAQRGAKYASTLKSLMDAR